MKIAGCEGSAVAKLDLVADDSAALGELALLPAELLCLIVEKLSHPADAVHLAQTSRAWLATVLGHEPYWQRVVAEGLTPPALDTGVPTSRTRRQILPGVPVCPSYAHVLGAARRRVALDAWQHARKVVGSFQRPFRKPPVPRPVRSFDVPSGWHSIRFVDDGRLYMTSPGGALLLDPEFGPDSQWPEFEVDVVIKGVPDPGPWGRSATPASLSKDGMWAIRSCVVADQPTKVHWEVFPVPRRFTPLGTRPVEKPNGELGDSKAGTSVRLCDGDRPVLTNVGQRFHLSPHGRWAWTVHGRHDGDRLQLWNAQTGVVHLKDEPTSRAPRLSWSNHGSFWWHCYEGGTLGMTKHFALYEAGGGLLKRYPADTLVWVPPSEDHVVVARASKGRHLEIGVEPLPGSSALAPATCRRFVDQRAIDLTSAAHGTYAVLRTEQRLWSGVASHVYVVRFGDGTLSVDEVHSPSPSKLSVFSLAPHAQLGLHAQAGGYTLSTTTSAVSTKGTPELPLGAALNVKRAHRLAAWGHIRAAVWSPHGRYVALHGQAAGAECNRIVIYDALDTGVELAPTLRARVEI